MKRLALLFLSLTLLPAYGQQSGTVHKLKVSPQAERKG